MAKRKKKPVKVAIIGLGRAGWNIHAKRLKDDKRFQITAVTDGLAERRQEAEETLGCVAYKSAEEMLANCDAELVINAAPSPLHGPLSIDGFKSGRHVVVEKPVAVDAKELRKMMRAADKAGKKLFCHHNYRFNEMNKHMLDIKESGIIGDIFEIRIQGSGFNRRNDWQTLKRYNGGLLNNHGTHHIDTALYVLDSKVKNYWCDMKLISDAGNTEDHFKVMAKLRSGAVVDVQFSSSNANPSQGFQMLGTCGSMISNGKESTIKYFDPKRVKDLPVVTQAPEGRKYGSGDVLPWKEKTVKVQSKRKGDFYDNVYEVLRERGKMVVTPESVLEVVKLIDNCKSTRIDNWRPEYGKKTAAKKKASKKATKKKATKKKSSRKKK